MIISILTGGSRGDVQPYIALGKGLKDIGYDVHLIASDDFETMITDAGLIFRSTGISVEKILQSEEWRDVTESGNFLAIASKMQQESKKRAKELAIELPSLLQGTDIILTGVGGFGGGFSIAEKLNIPLIQAYVFPITPTSKFPSPLTPNLPFGKILNTLSFKATQQILWQSTHVGDVETRRLLGMSKASFWGPFQKLAQMKTPTLYGYSQHVLPSPSDWDARYHITGYWFLDAANDWTPPSDLLEFLDAGEPPVYIGFGSMGSRNPQEAGQIALEALAKSGQRGVLAAGWGGLQSSDLPNSVFSIKSIPHSWLFPRMAAVVHHGGAGTTAAGLRAGIPSIVIPFMGDQAFWGHRIAQLGVGTEPIPRKKLTSEKLANAIKDAISNTMMQQKAAILGEKIRAEGGVQNAVDVIKKLNG